MKRLFLAFVLILITVCSASAQEYKVRSVKGTVKVRVGKKQSNACANMDLTASDILSIDNGASIVIIDCSTMQEYTIKNGQNMTVEKLLATPQVSFRQLSKSYFDYVLSRLSTKSNGTISVSASSEREVGDSIFLAPTHCDTIKVDTIK